VFSGITSVVTANGRPSLAGAQVGAVIVRPMAWLADDFVHPERALDRFVPRRPAETWGLGSVHYSP